LTEIHHRHRPRIFGYVLQMTDDRDLTEDVFCATFVTIFENLERDRPCGRLPNYLLRSPRSRLMDELQARRRLRTPLPAADTSGVSTPAGAALPADKAAAASELARRVQCALAELPDNLREVIVLRNYEGLDYAAIGKIVGAGDRRSAAGCAMRWRHFVHRQRLAEQRLLPVRDHHPKPGGARRTPTTIWSSPTAVKHCYRKCSRMSGCLPRPSSRFLMASRTS
jgi:RNA polymerase sigma factor (sigma-70 family)